MSDDEWKKHPKTLEMAKTLLKCRDALPAITDVRARLFNVDLSLDKEIERLLEPWLVAPDDPNGI